MNFLYPGFLIAFVVLLVPILIHLFNFQKFKKVYFSNVRFLKQISQETESRSKLKKYLILLSRLLAFSALVLAFAQPFLGNEGSKIIQGQKAVSVYVDNSFSMQAEGQFGNLFELAKKKAGEIIKAFGNSDKFQIITNDFEGKHQRLVNKEQALQLIDELKLSPSFKTTDAVYQRQRELLFNSEAPDKRIYHLTDLQKSSFGNAISKPDTSIFYNLLPLPANSQNNVYVDSVWFASPVNQLGLKQTVYVQIRNNSDREVDNAALKLFMNNLPIASTSITASAQQTIVVPVSFLLKTAGIKHCLISLEDFPVTYDDKFYFSFSVNKNIPVLVINDTETKSSSAFRALLTNDSLFTLSELTTDKIDFSQFVKNDLIILNGLKELSNGLVSELKKFREAGGSIAFFPSSKGDVNSYNSFLTSFSANSFSKFDTINTRVDRIESASSFFEGVFDKKPENVDLPKLFSYFKILNLSRGSGEVLMRLMDGSSFLSLYRGKGNFYVCNASLDEEGSNFARHALFVPCIIRMAINSQQTNVPYYLCGASNSIFLQSSVINKEKPLTLVSVQSKMEFIPEQQISNEGIVLRTYHQPEQAGNYDVRYGSEIIEGLAFNFSRKESDLKCLTEAELNEIISSGKSGKINLLDVDEKSLTNEIMNATYGKKIWRLFLLLAILFFCIEIALIRLMK